MRKMASVRKISDISPIVGADAIEVATIDGWKVVVKKGEFFTNDLAVYCEIDSWIPTEIASFLSKGKEPREFEGVKGERLKTIKLRGQLSQGLLLPYAILGRIAYEGEDVSEELNIKKWEMPVPLQLAGQVKGNFPSQIPKTDQERCQNLVTEIQAAYNNNLLFEITEKLEGSSMTCYAIDGVFGVCSRNLDLKRDENNAFWKAAIKYNIEEKLLSLGQDIAIQGELIGPGIQGNIYNLKDVEFHIFDVYDIKAGEFLVSETRRALVETRLELNHVPVIAENISLATDSIDTLLELAEGKSILNSNQEREGIVFKQSQGGITFKAISNKYLLKSSN